MIDYSTIQTINGVKVLDKDLQNGLAVITNFNAGSTLYLPMGSFDISPNYMSIGTFYFITNYGDQTAKPDLTIKIIGQNPNIFVPSSDSTSDSFVIKHGETVLFAKSYNGDNVVTAGVIAGQASAPVTIPIATASVLGGVKVGSGLSVDGTGLLSAPAPALPIATTSVLGGVKVGSGLSVDGTGLLSAPALPVATASVLGGVKVGTGLSVDGTGLLSLTASVQQSITNNITNPAAATIIQGATINLPAGKWFVTASQLTAATGTIPVGTNIRAKISNSTTDMTDDATVMSASVVDIGAGAGGRFGSNLAAKAFTLASAANIYVNYQTSNALTGTVYFQIVALKL